MRNIKEKLSGALGAGYLALDQSNFNNLVNPDPNKTSDPKAVTLSIINYALFFVGVIAIVFVVWGGIQFIMAGGDADKVTKAKNTILYAILGVVVIVLAFAIVNWAKGWL